MIDPHETNIDDDQPTMPTDTGADDDPFLALQKDVDTWKDTAYRAVADLENARRRFAQRESELQAYAAERVLARLLPILDDLHSAVDAAGTSTDADALRSGLDMIHRKAIRLFEDLGVHHIDVPAGTPFDVERHEALMHMPSELPEGQVVQEVQRGYMLHDKILRHSKVITSAGTQD